MSPRRVVLVGFMGAGKSTVGPLLGARLGWPFVDLDEAVATAAGLTVPEIFAREGEAAFRRREREAAAAVGREDRVVVATGGGAFACADTRAVLQAGALTVWLRGQADTLLARIPADGSRPLARNRERIVRLLAEREPSYRLADLTVDIEERTPAELADRIAQDVLARCASPKEP